MKSVENVLESLNKLALYHLSLSSKELFHSNFLAWLLKNYPKECCPILLNFIKEDKQSSFQIKKVTREEKNIDLTIYFENDNGQKKVLYIENKVKSIPNLEQLKKYSIKNDSGYFLLLSLSKANFDIKLAGKWETINYGELAILLRSIDICANNNNAVYLNEYIQLIDLLNELYEIVDSIKFEIYDIYSEENSIFKALNREKIGDVFVKLYHQKMANLLISSFSNEKEIENLINEELLTIKQEYTRGTGITDIRYWFIFDSSKVALSIQLQEMNLKLMVQVVEGGAIRVATKLLDDKLWFDFSSANCLVEGEKFIIYPKNKNKKFNCYTEKHLYQRIKISICSIDDLISVLRQYIIYIHKMKDEIRDSIKSIERKER